MSADPCHAFVTRVPPGYPATAPYHPSSQYPEFGDSALSDEPNRAFEGVREVLRLSGLDGDRFGKDAWNPLGEVLQPGQMVVVKPNMVKECHPTDPEGWLYVVTHGSIIRAVCDYIWKAIGPSGRVIIADAPQTDSSFERLRTLLGLDELASFYSEAGLTLEVIDLRQEEWQSKDGVIVSRVGLSGDPRGNVAYNLATDSEFVGHRGGGRYYGADYDDNVVNSHHVGGRHEYLISGSVIRCDALVSIPKLKTHKKAGITVSVKNLVGVNADKNWLPHHTEGSPSSGGDERPATSRRSRFERRVVRSLRQAALRAPNLGTALFRFARRRGTAFVGDTETIVRSGNWHGNDTLWRMCLDLFKIVAYGEPDGTLRPPSVSSQKPHLVFVDGVSAGEGSGPMNPHPA